MSINEINFYLILAAFAIGVVFGVSMILCLTPKKKRCPHCSYENYKSSKLCGACHTNLWMPKV